MDNNIIDKRTKGEWKLGTSFINMVTGMENRIFPVETKQIKSNLICWTFENALNKGEAKANAAFIVKACNEYERLIDEETRRISAEVAMEIIAEERDKLRNANKELLEALKDASSYLLSLASWQTEQKKFDTIVQANDQAQEAIKKHSPIN